MPATQPRDTRAITVLAIAFLALFGWLIVTRMELFYAKNEASDYRALWKAELGRRQMVQAGPRIEAIERRTALVAAVVEQQSPEVRHDIKRRLADIRVHFSGLVRPSRPRDCPRLVKQPPAVVPAPRADETPDPRSVASDRHLRNDREIDARLTDLQAWVRQHMGAYHGVRL